MLENIKIFDVCGTNLAAINNFGTIYVYTPHNKFTKLETNIVKPNFL